MNFGRETEFLEFKKTMFQFVKSACTIEKNGYNRLC